MINPIIYLRQLKNENEGSINLKFYIKGERVVIASKIHVNIKDWNDKTCRVKSSDKKYSDKNLILENILARINNVDVKYRLKDKPITRDLFLRNYNRPDDFQTFHAFCEDFIRDYRKRIEVTTYRMHLSVLAKFKDFDPNIHFDDLNANLFEKYVYYLKKKLNNNDNTAHKNLAVLKKYVLQAIRAGYMETNPFTEFRVKQSRPNVSFLDEEELKLLFSFYRKDEYTEQKHKKALQFFLYMCFSSQHVGDARLMKIENFTNVNFTYFRLKLQHRKPEPITVPISTPLRMLLNDIIEDRTRGRLFEGLPSDQRMNIYLKDIATELGINKNISHKTARHTFATIFLENNHNPKVLQDILGHSDIKQTMVYVHALEKTKQRGISCFDKFV